MQIKGKVWLKSGNMVDLPQLEVSEDDAEVILRQAATSNGYVAWSGYAIRLENVEAFRLWEVEE